MIHSVRFRLTLWYLVILALILSLFGWVLYSSVKNTLFQDIDRILISQADGVSDSIFAFWKAEQNASDFSPGGIQDSFFKAIQNEIEIGLFPDVLNRWAQEVKSIAATRPIRIASRKGSILLVSSSFFHLRIPLDDAALKQAYAGHTVYETFQLQDHRVRLITRPVFESRHMLYFVQVAASLQQADNSLDRLRTWLFWLIPMTLLVSTAVGWFLVSMALKPIGKMIRQAEQIGAERLQERIDVPKTQDELERLAVTFNQMLTRLESAFKRIRQFTAAASHELRTPLTVMRGELELALRKPREAEAYQSALHAHLDMINEMSRIVDQLLTLARSELGDQSVERRPVQLKILAEKIIDLYRPLAESKQIALEVFLGEGLQVRGDARLLERLFANLLDNAIKHTFAGGHIQFRGNQIGHEISIAIEDSGPGIPDEAMPHIFDRFFSEAARQGEENPPRGFGLGLCRWIAEVHQGRIEAANLPGKGALFTVFLPFAAP